MSTEAKRLAANKAIAAVHYRYLGDPERAMSAMADDVIYHGRPGAPATLAVWKERERRFHLAMGDIRTTIQQQIAEGDLVLTYWTLEAIHRGTLMQYPATGRSVVMKSMCIDRIAGDRVVEHWGVRDLLSVLRQIGAVEEFRPDAKEKDPR